MSSNYISCVPVERIKDILFYIIVISLRLAGYKVVCIFLICISLFDLFKIFNFKNN